jgi:hypothetical protein
LYFHCCRSPEKPDCPAAMGLGTYSKTLGLGTLSKPLSLVNLFVSGKGGLYRGHAVLMVGFDDDQLHFMVKRLNFTPNRQRLLYGNI